MRTPLRLAAAGAAAVVLASGGFAGADEDCRDEFSDGHRVDAGPVTLYTDDAETYLGVCGFGRNGYVQVNELSRVAAGELPLAEGRTGDKDIDKELSNGPIKVWVVRSAEDACAPDGDQTVGGGGGGQSPTRDLPVVYTDEGEHRVGVCTRDGRYVEVGELADLLAGEVPVEIGRRDDG